MNIPVVYILANKKHGTIYVGVTSDLARRLFQHQEGLVKGFSSKYDCRILVFFEQHPTMESAILREKQIKAGSRAQKIKLIESENPEWNDLTRKALGLDP